MKKISFFIKLVSLIIIFTVTAIFGAIGLHMVLAWDGPTASPPNNNVDKPLNVGSSLQTKAGGLNLAEIYIDGGIYTAKIDMSGNALAINAENNSDWDFAVYEGSVHSYNNFYLDTITSCSGKLYTDVSGQVLCGTDASGGETLAQTLAIGNTSGGTSINMGADAIVGTDWSLDYTVGVGSKLTIDIVDPLYSIDGEKFSTYGPSITGAKEETTGKVSLSCWLGGCYSIIDFDREDKGSDLWLFYQVTDLGKDWDNLVVLLTPEGNNDVWYKLRPEKNQVIIYGKKETKVSYRLTAPRFDHENWPNESDDYELEGLKVEAKK